MKEDKVLTITVDEAAEMLRIGRNNMLQLIKEEDFPALQFKRKIIINKKQFVEWFDKITEKKLNI